MIQSSDSTARGGGWVGERALPTRINVTPAMALAVVPFTARPRASETADDVFTACSALGGHPCEHWATGPTTGSSFADVSGSSHTTPLERTRPRTNARSTPDPRRSRGKHANT